MVVSLVVVFGIDGGGVHVTRRWVERRPGVRMPAEGRRGGGGEGVECQVRRQASQLRRGQGGSEGGGTSWGGGGENFLSLKNENRSFNQGEQLGGSYWPQKYMPPK